MASLSLSRIIEKMKLINLTPEIDITGIKVNQPDINRIALQIRRFHAPSVGQNANTRHSRRPISRLRFGYAFL